MKNLITHSVKGYKILEPMVFASCKHYQQKQKLFVVQSRYPCFEIVTQSTVTNLEEALINDCTVAVFHVKRRTI